jgi:predicted nucleotidyltransferase component of viral defense system
MSTLHRPPTAQIKFLEDNFDINPLFTEKDWYTQHILGVISKFESDDFQPVFSGGTSLSKGHQLIQRFSEDVDFRMLPLKDNLTRTFRSSYQDRLIEAILASSPDLKLVEEVKKRDRSRFLQFKVSYPSEFLLVDAVRPYIQVELSFEPPQLQPQIRPVASLINQFTQQPAEIAGMACLNLSETTADKLAALSWRVMGKEPDADRYDPRIIRHLYDLSFLAPKVSDDPSWSDLSYKTIARDLQTRDRSLANKIKTPDELLDQLISRLTTNPIYANHYKDFVETVAYGESPSFQQATDSLSLLVNKLQSSQIKPSPAVKTEQIRYQPTRGELLNWYATAERLKNENVRNYILGLGKKLAAEFNAGSINGQLQEPPKSYSSPNVTVSKEFYSIMADIDQTSPKLQNPQKGFEH